MERTICKTLAQLTSADVVRVTSAGQAFKLDLSQVDEKRRELIAGYIARLVYHVPRWVRSLRIVSRPTEGDGKYADVGYDLRYGYATINLYANFFESEYDERAETILHELAHLTLAPMISMSDRLAEQLEKNGQRGEAFFLRDQIERVEEAIVSDIAHVSLIELSLRGQVTTPTVEFIETLPLEPTGKDYASASEAAT